MGGGIILLGVDENQKFAVVGVKDAQAIQADVSGVAAQMEPALQPEFTVEDIDGKTVVAIEIASVPTDLKPCYFKPAGINGGSYIRVGNITRHMTGYEIFGYLSARQQPSFDEEPIADADLDSLDIVKIDTYIAELRQTRP